MVGSLLTDCVCGELDTTAPSLRALLFARVTEWVHTRRGVAIAVVQDALDAVVVVAPRPTHTGVRVCANDVRVRGRANSLQVVAAVVVLPGPPGR